MKKEDLQNRKIRVNSAKESKEIQEILFANGFSWRTLGSTLAENIYQPFLYTYDHYIAYGKKACVFLGHEHKEITLDELRQFKKNNNMLTIKIEINGKKKEEESAATTADRIKKFLVSQGVQKDICNKIVCSVGNRIGIEPTCNNKYITKAFALLMIIFSCDTESPVDMTHCSGSFISIYLKECKSWGDVIDFLDSYSNIEVIKES